MRVICWNVRYLDRNDRQFKDRNLQLFPADINPVEAAAIELLIEAKDSHENRRIIKYRHLFHECSNEDADHKITSMGWVGLLEYYEDETGSELSLNKIGQILTGNPNAMSIPHGAKRHDVELMLAPAIPQPLAEVSLSAQDVRILSVFCRDLKELSNSGVMREGPGTLHLGSAAIVTPTSQVWIETAFSDDEARSFVTILRRLYMDKEPANFCKAAQVYVAAIGNHPRAQWVEGVVNEYRDSLAGPPDSRAIGNGVAVTFSVKRLIDVFLYTQYAHQPDAKREQQFRKCLAEVMGHSSVLTWLFFVATWKLAIQMRNAGNVITSWFHAYLQHHGIANDSLPSMKDEHAGIGVLERKKDREDRLFEEKAEELARNMWQEDGRPDGGPSLYLPSAKKSLRELLGD